MKQWCHPRLGRGLAALALSTVGVLGLAGVAPASASEPGARSVVASAGLRPHGSSQPKTYAQRLADYHRALRHINQRFGRRLSIAVAKYKLALARARSAQDKLNARSAYRSALLSATNEREVELESLGSAPEHSASGTSSGSDASSTDASSSSPDH